MVRERQKVAMVKYWQHQRAYFKHDGCVNQLNDEEVSRVESNMLADLKAELEG